MMKRNPLVGVDLPKGAKRRVKTLEPEDIRKFAIQTLRESVNWMRPLAAMAAGSGARRGEMLAADWKSLNVRHGHIVFDKSLGQTREGVYVKATKSGEERVVPLPAFVLRELEVHRQRQEKHRAMFGEAYRTDLDLIFAEPDGNHLKPDSVTAKVCLVMRKLGLDGSLHTLRHSLASELFDVVPTTTISKRLGHSNVRTTTEIYSHGVRRRDTEAADAVEETLGPMFGDKVM